MLKLFLEKVTFGIARSSSEPPSICRASRFSALNADTAIGTSCSDCSRFWAVTMTSSTVVAGPAVGADAVSWAHAGAAAIRMASADAPPVRRAQVVALKAITVPPPRGTAPYGAAKSSVSCRV